MSLIKLIFISIIFPVLLQVQMVCAWRDYDAFEIRGQVTDAETDLPLAGETENGFHERVEFWLNKGLKAKQNGEFEQALAIWAEAMEVLPEASYAIGREYVQLVAEQQMKQYYEQATSLYYRGLVGELNRAVDQAALEKDLLYLELIMDSEEADQILLMRESDHDGLLASVRRFWRLKDPTPLHANNQRLIEHFTRIQQAKARFTDPDSPLGFDDRGKIYMRYGEPDKTLDRQLRVRLSEIHGFVSEIVGTASAYSLDGPAPGLERRINSNPVSGDLDIWVYEKFNKDMKDKAVFYFQEGKSNSWNQIDSIDDWIPFGLYAPTRSNVFAGVTPALVLQYFYYRQLTEFDPFFMSLFNRLDTDIFVQSAGGANLAIQRKAKNRHEARMNRLAAPAETSSEASKIPRIPLVVYQYRLLDEQGTPVLATFMESRPAAAFLIDLTASQEQLHPDTESDIPGLLTSGLLTRWFTLRQGVDLLDETGPPCRAAAKPS